MRRISTFLLLASLAPLVSIGAQESSRASWAAWLGCWAPANAPSAETTTCVLPGSNDESVEIVRLDRDSVVQRSSIIADGVTRPVSAEGCVGEEAARFSEDGNRVFLTGEVSCDRGPLQKTSGVMSISETGQFIDVHGIRIGDRRELRVRRAMRLRDVSGLPLEIRDAVAPLDRRATAGRIGASVPLSPERVIEASQAVDERVVEAWMIESSRDAEKIEPLDARELERLAKAKVPERVLDVYVALGYPKAFQVALAPNGAGDVAAVEAPRTTAGAHPRYYDPSPFAFGGYEYDMLRRCYYFGGISCYAGYPYSSYMSYGLSGWNSYGGFGMYPGWGSGPIVIVRPQPGGGTGGSPESNGRVVKGRGYTQRDPSGGEPAQPRTNVRPATEASSSSGARGSSSTSSSSGSSESKPRTAKPRNP